MCVLSPEAAINVKKASRGSLATEKPGYWGVSRAGVGHRWDKCAPRRGIHSSRVWPFTFYLTLCPRLRLGDSSENISERCQEETQRLVSKCHGDARDDVWFAVCEEILFWVSCDSLPYCPVKQEGQATEKEHMSAFPSAAAPTCVTSSSLSPPARPKPYTVYTNASLQQQNVSA